MRSGEIVEDGPPAYEARVPDESLRVYMQTQPFAGKVQAEAYRPTVDAFRTHFKERPRAAAGPLGRAIELEDGEAAPTDEFKRALEPYFDSLRYKPDEAERLVRDLGWKVERLPGGMERILAAGCGGGGELIFLRARFPGAKITAIDYRTDTQVRTPLFDRLDVEFIHGDIFATVKSLESRGDCYDLIFSNHVIEHFFEPDEQIGSLARLLSPGGVFSAGLPLDAYPFADLLARTAKAPGAIHALDMNWLDVRHPWKTNEADLAATLRKAGLDDVAIYRRANHANRAIDPWTQPLCLDECRRYERRARRVYALLLQPVLVAMKFCFGQNPPRLLARLLFAVERRLWFGRYRVSIDVRPEVFVTAIRRR